MKICGIICEYNPLHNGHKYLIDKAREESNADFIVCVMSGNFTQRGQVAVFDKFKRAEHAILAGADAVIELPTAFAISPAELFAKGAVKLLSSIPDLTNIAFGVENGTVQAFENTAKILSTENKQIKAAIKGKLKEGFSFVKARADAISELDLSGIDKDLILKPNNILGLEYQKALNFFESNAKILPILRIGAEYSDCKMYSNFSSATAIRECILNKKWRLLKKNLPPFVFKDVKNTTSSDLYKKIAIYTAMTKAPSELKKIVDCTEGLENRIQAFAKDNNDYDTLLEKVTTKRYITSRIRRILLAAVLGIEEDLIKDALKSKLYLKVLATKKEKASDILSLLKKSEFPVITRRSDLSNLSKTAKELINKDFQANDVYQLVSGTKVLDNSIRLI